VPKEKVWEPIEGGNKFKCKLCDYSHADPGAVQLHHSRRHPVKKVESAGKKSGGHVHTWRLLRPGDPQEAQAINLGFSKVCKDKSCEELGGDD
jgi:hypothetical protein